jgi:hypothetical protein
MHALRTSVLAILGLCVVGYASIAAFGAWINAHRIGAGPDNQTRFLQSYDPEPVIRNFRDQRESYQNADGAGAESLIRSIHQTRNFQPGFTMQSDREPQLLIALRDDIVLRLRSSGASITATLDDADGGFTYQYSAPGSVGSITVRPPKYHAATRRYPVPTGLDDVYLQINLEETWIRPKSTTEWWMAMVD